MCFTAILANAASSSGADYDLEEKASIVAKMPSLQLEEKRNTSTDLNEVDMLTNVENNKIIAYYNLSGNISNSNKGRTLGELKYLFNNYVEYDDPLVRHTALVIAATSPGEYSIEQICKIYNYIRNENYLTKGWSYIQDPREKDYYQSASETLKIGKDAGYAGVGDCDDFAILMAALIEAIGGTTRIILADGPSGSHAYAEVYLGQLDDQRKMTDEVIDWLKQEYNTNNVYLHTDKNTKDVWLNLDWGPENKESIELYHPGGPIYPADKHFVIRIQNESDRSVPKLPEKIRPTAIDPLNITYTNNWVDHGLLLYDQGNYEASLDAFSKAIQQDPENAMAWKLKGAALNALSRFEDGINCLNKALDLDPQSGNAWELKGFALNQLGRFEEGLECTNKSIELEPNSNAWNNKGFSFYALGKYENAIDCYENAISFDPNCANCWSNKGIALNEQGNYEEARMCFDKAIVLNPKNAARYEREKRYAATLG